MVHVHVLEREETVEERPPQWGLPILQSVFPPFPHSLRILGTHTDVRCFFKFPRPRFKPWLAIQDLAPSAHCLITVLGASAKSQHFKIKWTGDQQLVWHLEVLDSHMADYSLSPRPWQTAFLLSLSVSLW